VAERKAFWNFTLACILIAIVNTVSLLLIGPYGSTMAATASLPLLPLLSSVMDTYLALHVLPPLLYITVLWVLAAIIGSLIAAVSSGNFAITRPSRGQVIRSFIGGLLMGTALLLAGGCNLGHLGMVPLLVPASMLAYSGIAMGAYLGVRFMLWRVTRQG
jgi:hypothetical protein